MADLRRPAHILLLRSPPSARSTKVEIFYARDFYWTAGRKNAKPSKTSLWRVRVDGRWHNQGRFMTTKQVLAFVRLNTLEAPEKELT